jgi:hypothetical protein
MHLAGLTGLATDIAFLQGGATYGRLRTAIINATMRVCGSRFGRGWLRPGGVRFGLTPGLRRDLLDTLAAFSKDIGQVNELMLGARSVRSRFQGVGTVSRRRRRSSAWWAWRRAPAAWPSTPGPPAGPPVRGHPVNCSRRQRRLLGAHEAAHARDRRIAALAARRARDAADEPAQARRCCRWARSGPTRCVCPCAKASAGRWCRRWRPAPTAAAALQGAGSVAAQLVRPGASPCATTRSRTSRSATRASISPTAATTCRRAPGTSLFKSIAVRVSQGSQYIPDPRRASPAGFRGRPVIGAADCARPAARPAWPPARRPRSSSIRCAIDLGRCVLCGDCEPACPSARFPSTTTCAWPPPTATG